MGTGRADHFMPSARLVPMGCMAEWHVLLVAGSCSGAELYLCIFDV